MSFIISVFVNEGIVLASDSRTTYNNTRKNGLETFHNYGVYTTDSTDRTFLANQRIGISTCGDASIAGIPITGYIENYIRQYINEKTDINAVPESILKYFKEFSPVPNVNFIIAGYSRAGNGLEQMVYKVRVAGDKIEKLEVKGQGATWDGETITLTKVIQPTAIKKPDGGYSDFPHFEIPWGLFTLKDAIGFAKYAVDITIQTMRYQLVVENVGGPVDILAIKPDGAMWIQKKLLNIVLRD